LTIDNLLGADVVTASGEVVRASETENPDLFWALRGGGGNFGLVTAFSFRAHALGPEVFAGTFIYQLPRWAEALRAFAAWGLLLPDALTSIITFMVPPAEWELGDRALMLVGFAWAGAERAEGERVVGRLRVAAPPDTELLEPTRWVAWQSAFDALVPKGVRAYWKNAAFAQLDDAMIETIVEQAGAQTWYGTAADLHHLAGAFGRVPEESTPFPNRSARFWLNVYGFWADPADDLARTAWVRGFATAMAPYATTGEYINFLGAEGPQADPHRQALLAYGPVKLARLAALKRRYDPENLFRLNHNIPPTL
jgi:FAD/FMN-containing dehydrogenase